MRKMALLVGMLLLAGTMLFAQEPAPEVPTSQPEEVAVEPPAPDIVLESPPAEAPAAVPEAPAPAPAATAKFVVFLPERIDTSWFWFYYTEEVQHIVQSAVEKALISSGLEVIDVGTGTFESSGNIDQVTSKDLAVSRAKQMGAAYVIVGTATADKGSSSTAYGVNVVRASADITARLVRVSDGKILAVEDASAAAGGEALRTAGKEALKVAGADIARKLAAAARTAANAP